MSIRLACDSSKGPDSRPFRLQLVKFKCDCDILDEVDLVHDVNAVAEAFHSKDVFTQLSSGMTRSNYVSYHVCRFELCPEKSVSIADRQFLTARFQVGRDYLFAWAIRVCLGATVEL